MGQEDWRSRGAGGSATLETLPVRTVRIEHSVAMTLRASRRSSHLRPGALMLIHVRTVR